MKFKINATIPVGQYANIMPEIEVEAETYELAQAEALHKLESIWKQYGVVPLNKTGGDRKLLQAFVGGEIYYDEAAHVYTNEAGEVYLSGSQYAKKFEKPFDGQAIAGKMAAKYGVEAKDISKMWELKARTSREFGTALHSALELYGRYDGLAKALERDTAMHDHPIIKKAVEGFYEGRKDEKAEYEILIVDHAQKHAGQIDRLLITGDKKCRVQDFKTGATIKDIELYWRQLGFYKEIMEAAGWTVEGLDVFHWDGSWHDYSK